MYYSSHNNKLDDSTIKSNSKLIWLAMQAGTLMLGGCVYLMETALQHEAVLPEFKNVFIGICIFSIPIAFLLLGRIRRCEREINTNFHANTENPRQLLQNYIGYLISGLALAELPAMFGLVLYITAGEFILSLFFIFTAFIIGFFYKPAL